MLSLNNVSCQLDSRPILQEVSFSLSASEFLSIVGPNGAGKTTLLRCILQLLPYKGEITLENKNLSGLSRRELASRVAYIPQLHDPLPDFTVREFIEMGLYPIVGTFAREDDKRRNIEDICNLTDLQGLEQRLLTSLSGGEIRRVLLAAALASEAGVLVLDEPAIHLDPAYEMELYRVLEGVRQSRHVAILLVSHDINRSALSSTRVIAIKGGKLVFDDVPEGFINSKVLGDVYGTEFSIVKHSQSSRFVALPSGVNISKKASCEQS